MRSRKAQRSRKRSRLIRHRFDQQLERAAGFNSPVTVYFDPSRVDRARRSSTSSFTRVEELVEEQDDAA